VQQEKTEEMAGTPSLADIAAAMKVLQPEPKKSAFEANLSTIITAAFLGLAGWLLLGLNSMQQTVTQVSATVAAMSKTIDQMAQDAKAGDSTQSDMKEKVARLDQRVSALEGRGDDGTARRPQNGGSTGAPASF
jgi:outer membrane murein-binding lipoprotein Lpp